jgi:alpha-D-xyloside xylohydrolase
VTQPSAASRSVILPAGNDWVDFWSGKAYHGGQTIVADAPLDQIPILVKAGSIVPMGPQVQSTADAQDPIEIRVYGGRDADFLLYEDSGDSYAYEHGARATIDLHWDDRRNALSIGDRTGTFPGMRTKRTFRIVLVKQGHGIGFGSDSGVDRSVTYDGHRMRIDLGRQS